MSTTANTPKKDIIYELTYGQHWLPQLEPDFNPGKVILQRRGDVLEIEAILTDSDIHDSPAAFNDEAYRHGDVFELFIKAEGSSTYYEIHVTPSNVLLQLRFTVGEPLDLDKARIWDSQFLESGTEHFDGGWKARLKVPLSKLTSQNPIPALWKIACGRYDYIPNENGRRRSRISNTAPLTAPNFHRHQEWPVYDLGGQ